jgi:hypothetical protein
MIFIITNNGIYYKRRVIDFPILKVDFEKLQKCEKLRRRNGTNRGIRQEEGVPIIVNSH